MKIQNPSTIPFKSFLRIPLKDKSRSPLVINQTPMDKIFSIASANETPLFIAKDVFILSSSESIKGALKEGKINFEEVENIYEY